MNDNPFALPEPSATNAEHFEAFGYAVPHADFITLSPAEGGQYTPHPLFSAVTDDFENGSVIYTLAMGEPVHA